MKVLQEIRVPKENVNDEYMIVSKLFFKTGDSVKKGDGLLDLETSKVVITIESECDGFVEYVCEETDTVEIGKLICRVCDIADFSGYPIETDSATAADGENDTAFSRAALDLMEKENIPKSRFAGMDFVSAADVVRTLPQTAPADKSREAAPVTQLPIETEFHRISMSKRTEIRNLQQVQSAGLNSMAAVFVDVSGIFETTNSSFALFKDSLLPIVIYETSRLLRTYPEFNAFFADGGIVQYKKVHVGVAMDMGKGLKVGKISDSDLKTPLEVEAELIHLVERYENGRLTTDDVTGATFTITDLSFDGVEFFMPLINSFQSAVLGISGVDELLNRCALTLTFDHRVTEGRKAGRFLKDLKERLESYNTMNKSAGRTDAIAATDARCHLCNAGLDQDKRMDGRGLIRILDHDGTKKYICHLCLMGY